MTTEQEDLQALEAHIAELQAKRQAILAGQRATKLTDVKAAIQQFGYSASELGLAVAGTRGKAASTNKPMLVAKYVNPSDASQTWHGGRGAKPKWLKAFLEAGGKLADIEIRK